MCSPKPEEGVIGSPKPFTGSSEPFDVGARASRCTLRHHDVSLAPTHSHLKTGTLKGVWVLLRLEMYDDTFSPFILLKARAFMPSPSFYFTSYSHKSKICIRVSFGYSHAQETEAFEHFKHISWLLGLLIGFYLRYNVIVNTTHLPWSRHMETNLLC